MNPNVNSASSDVVLSLVLSLHADIMMLQRQKNDLQLQLQGASKALEEVREELKNVRDKYEPTQDSKSTSFELTAVEDKS